MLFEDKSGVYSSNPLALGLRYGPRYQVCIAMADRLAIASEPRSLAMSL